MKLEWTLERQERIQRAVGLLIPPKYLGGAALTKANNSRVTRNQGEPSDVSDYQPIGKNTKKKKQSAELNKKIIKREKTL